MTFRSYATATSGQTLYAHQETTTINGGSYYLHQLSSADGNGTTLIASATTTGRKLMGRWVYPLSGVISIPASTWTVTYRAKIGASGKNIVAHADVDILIRMSNGTVRSTIATNVANSPSLTQINTWETLTGTYNWSAYTVVDQTDYLEVAYYIEVTTSQTSKKVYLRVDDGTLASVDQTKIANIMLPSEYTMEVEFTGTSNIEDWTRLVWTIDSAWTTASVSVTLQLYNYQTGQYPTSGDGYISYTSSSTPNTDETQSQTITLNPTYFRDANGNWKIKVEGVKSTTTQFDFKADLVEYKTTIYVAQAPIASFTYSPANPSVYDTVTFNASASYDPDGNIVSYRWDFGDDNITTVTDPIITHIYTTANSTVTYTVNLTVTDNEGLTNSTTDTVPVINPAILRISLPAGTYEGADPDPWLNDGWLLNITDASGTFTLRINNTSASITSYDTHLIIALNNASYNNLVSLSVNSTAIPKSAFQYGKPKPYNLWDWPSGDVYPTWFNDTYIFGTIGPKNYTDLIVSVTFSNATGARMHFDAYGSRDSPPPPSTKGKITHNALSKDSTVLFQPGAIPPHASFNYSPPYPQVSETVTFNATESYDPDGNIVNYTWNFGDSNTTTVTYPIITHHYTTFGNYTVNLTVTDNDDLANSTAKIVSVREHPVANFSWSPDSPQVGETVTFNGSLSTPDGGTIVSYEWDFGDGTPHEFGEIVTHVYNNNGTYTVTLNVTDSEGKWDTESKLITVGVKKYYLTVETDPADIVTIPGEGWYNNCTYVNLTAPAFVPNATGVNGERYRFDHWTVDGNVTLGNPITVHMDANHTATAHYVQQYLVTFDQTGLNINATGTVVTVNGSAKTFGDLPFTWWIDNCSWVEYSYNVTVSSLDLNENFTLINVTGLVSPFHVGGPVTVTGNYKIQYQVIFSQSGVDTDFTGTVVTIDGIGYGVGDLSKSFWWDKDSEHNFSFASPLVVNGGKRYVWTSTSGLSTSQNGTLTITSSGTITGHYKTQYLITFNQSGVGSDFTGTVVIIDGTDYTRDNLSYSFWWNNSSVHSFDFKSPLVVTPNAKRYVWTSTSGLSSLQSDSITVSSSGSITGNYKTQYYLTLATSPPSVTTPSGEGWYDAGTYAPISTAEFVDIVPGASRYRFINWTTSDMAEITNPALPSTTVLIDKAKTVTANYVTQYYLTVETYPDGLIPAPTPPSNWYDNSTNVVLEANLTAYLNTVKYLFIYWDVDGTNVTGNPINVHMDQPHNATAHYVKLSKCVVDFTEDPESPIEFGTTVTFTVNVTQKAFNGTHEVNCTLYEWNLTDPNGVSHIRRYGKQWNNFSDTMNWTFNVYGQWMVTMRAFCNDTALIDAGMAWSDPASHPKMVIRPVGGYIAPIEKLGLLAPWIGIILTLVAAMIATTTLSKYKSRKH